MVAPFSVDDADDVVESVIDVVVEVEQGKLINSAI